MKIEAYKVYKVVYRFNPKWGGHTITTEIEAENKTMARAIAIGTHNPGKVISIEEVKDKGK